MGNRLSGLVGQGATPEEAIESLCGAVVRSGQRILACGWYYCTVDGARGRSTFQPRMRLQGAVGWHQIVFDEPDVPRLTCRLQRLPMQYQMASLTDWMWMKRLDTTKKMPPEAKYWPWQEGAKPVY